MNKNNYSDSFYDKVKKGSLKSAREIVPYILEVVKPKSVIDVGCGFGPWLFVFQEMGLSEIMGIDGDWVNKNKLLIQQDQFLSVDLNKPFFIDKKFDLVVCLEVAEHLPEKSAEILVDSLIKLGSVIFFSAAIPFQGGTNHLNEQWPEYWIKLFQDRNYLVIDSIRKKFWDNNNIPFVYRQNCFIFVNREYLETNQLIKKEYENSNKSIFSIVHPKTFLIRAKQVQNLLRDIREYSYYKQIFLFIKKLPAPIKWIVFFFLKVLKMLVFRIKSFKKYSN